METRNVDFNGNEIYIVHDNGVDYVALKPVIESLGLKWVNEYERAKTKFNTQAHVLPILDGKLRSTLVINFGELEVYLNSFKNRSAGFKPHKGFWHDLQNCINILPNLIFESAPQKPKDEVDIVETIELPKDGTKDVIQESDKEKDVISKPEEKQPPDIETPQVDSKPSIDEQAIKQNGIQQIEPQSLTAFVVDDNFKRNIDEVLASLELFTSVLGEFGDKLKELRNSQFVLLENKTQN